MLIIFVTLYITSLILSYLITKSLHLFTTFIQFLPPPPFYPLHLETAILIFFPEFLFLWSIIDLESYVSFCYTTKWFDISIHLIMMSTVCLVMKCHIQRYYGVFDSILHTVHSCIYFLSCWSLLSNILSCWNVWMHFNNWVFFTPFPRLLFLTSYFLSFQFVYPLTTYREHRWFYYFSLLTFLLALMHGWSTTFTVY